MAINLLTLLSPRNLVLFVVVFTRLSGMFAVAPLVSTGYVPIQVKTWFMAAAALVIFPIVMAKTGFQMPTTIPELSVILIREFMIGYIVGFVSSVVFYGVEIAAEFVSMQMGLSAAQALNPMTSENAPILAEAYTILASLIFLCLNAYQWIFAAIYKTFEILPPGYGFLINGQITNNFIRVSSDIFIIGLGIALPIFSVLLITDILLGVTAKMIPKMNVFMVAMPAKIYIGLAVTVMLLHPILTHITLLIEKYIANIIPVLGG